MPHTHDIFLQAISSALPSWEVNNDVLFAWCGTDPEFTRSKIGVTSRHFLRAEESSLDLAAQACQQLFDNYSLLPQDVELLVFVSQTPEYGLPHSSALLQHSLGLPTHTACFDVGLGCSGYAYGLNIAKAIMLAENFSHALLVTCDTYSKIMNQQDKNTIPLFGDAATVTWLGRKQGAGIGKTDYGTDGQGAKALTLTAPLQGQLHDATIIGEDYPLPQRVVSMNGRAVFNFMLQRVPASVQTCLQKNALSIEDIDYFVFHQASRFMLETLGAQMKLPAEKVPILLENVGNTVSSSIPLALEKLQAQKLLQGKKVLISGFGVGLSWATTILHF